VPRGVGVPYGVVVDIGIPVEGLRITRILGKGVWLSEPAQLGVIPPCTVVVQIEVTPFPLPSISVVRPRCAAGEARRPEGPVPPLRYGMLRDSAARPPARRRRRR
jgi:hypothetical protein